MLEKYESHEKRKLSEDLMVQRFINLNKAFLQFLQRYDT